MSLFSHPAYDDHEHVSYLTDARSGLKAIIAIHSTVCGPGAGGVRMVPYASESEALSDVLRLSQGMSYKNAMAGLNLGGAKAVIIGDPQRDKTHDLLLAFGRAVEALQGRYITAGDVGMTPANMLVAAKETRYVTGMAGGERAAGDPSPYTAHGLVCAMRAALIHKTGSGDFNGVTVAVQGIGKVGGYLAEALKQEGADLVIAGRRAAPTQAIASKLGARVVRPKDILFQDVDILSPCALGGVFDDEIIPQLNCKIIVGGANNQLALPRHGAALRERGIVYVPDYICNAGGMMNVALEYSREFTSRKASMLTVERIGETVTQVLKQADKKTAPTNFVADSMARKRIGRA